MPVIDHYFDGSYYSRYSNWGNPYVEGPRPSKRLYHYDAKPDRVKARKPLGWLPPKPYHRLVQNERFAEGTFAFSPDYDPGASWVESGHIRHRDIGNIDEMNFLPYPLGIESRLLTKALLEVKGQNVNLGVAFAEGQKTANMIGTNFTKIARSYSSLRRGQFRRAWEHLGVRNKRDIPVKWLEMQYGWMPLLSDVHGAWQDVQAAGRGLGFLVTGKGKFTERENVSRVVSNHLQHVSVLGTRSARAMVRLDFEPESPHLQALAATGLTNPLEIAWELVPFSFVIDWIAPVGDWLSTFDATLGLSFKGGSISYMQRCDIRKTANQSPNPYYQPNWQGAYKALRLQRYVYTERPIPLPVIKNPFSLGHMANGLSLVAALFGR